MSLRDVGGWIALHVWFGMWWRWKETRVGLWLRERALTYDVRRLQERER